MVFGKWPGESCSDNELNDFQKQQYEDDGEDEREAATAVIAEAGTHAITAKAEDEDENDEDDKHVWGDSNERWQQSAGRAAGLNGFDAVGGNVAGCD
jgi:hypothetical protein